MVGVDEWNAKVGAADQATGPQPVGVHQIRANAAEELAQPRRPQDRVPASALRTQAGNARGSAALPQWPLRADDYGTPPAYLQLQRLQEHVLGAAGARAVRDHQGYPGREGHGGIVPPGPCPADTIDGP